jgi:hypothetical protein
MIVPRWRGDPPYWNSSHLPADKPGREAKPETLDEMIQEMEKAYIEEGTCANVQTTGFHGSYIDIFDRLIQDRVEGR